VVRISRKWSETIRKDTYPVEFQHEKNDCTEKEVDPRREVEILQDEFAFELHSYETFHEVRDDSKD